MTFIDDYFEETDDFNECDVKSWEWVEYHQNDPISHKDEQYYEPPKYDEKGYSRNWAIISRAIRDEREWTCEECNIELKDSKAKRRILHVHHRDRNKKNNHEKNLQVLCISCHSKREGHNHLSGQITYEDSRLIRSLRQEQYDRCKRAKFEIRCDAQFNEKQSKEADVDDWDDWCATLELRCNFEQYGKTQFNRGSESDQNICFSSNNDEYTRKRTKAELACYTLNAKRTNRGLAKERLRNFWDD